MDITARNAARLDRYARNWANFGPAERGPKGMREVTAAARGSSMGKGHYVRRGVSHG